MAESYKRMVLANEILAKIEKGDPIEYDHAIIKGDLDIKILNLPKNDGKPIIASSITIRNSRIEGKLNLQNTIVEKQAFFDHTIFQGYSCFGRD